MYEIVKAANAHLCASIDWFVDHLVNPSGRYADGIPLPKYTHLVKSYKTAGDNKK